MKKIIFLDIDGVLNCDKTFSDNNGIRLAYNKMLEHNKNKLSLLEYYEEYLNILLLEIDSDKIEYIKSIAHETEAEIVISSSWRNLRIYPLLEDYLIKKGLPIIGCTDKLNDRGEEIRDYISKNNLKNYIIIDDEVFNDFDENQKYNLIYTNFYDNGLKYDMIDEAIKKLVYK